MRALAVALILSLSVVATVAQETGGPAVVPEPLTNSAQPQSDPGRQQRSSEPRSTAPVPVIVNVLPPAKTEAEAQKEERERHEKADIDRRLVELTGDLAEYTRWLAYATIALFFVTAGLFVLAGKQAGDAKRAGDAAAESARAAKLSAEGSIKAELPIVIAAGFKIEVTPGTPHPPDNVSPPESPILKYRFANFGRTPAEIVSYCLEVEFGEALPDVPNYERIYDMVPGTFILPGDALQMQEIFSLTAGKLRDAYLAEKIGLRFFGFVRWTDYLGTPHESRFCTRALPHYQGPGKWFVFVLDGNTPAAYTQRT